MKGATATMAEASADEVETGDTRASQPDTWQFRTSRRGLILAATAAACVLFVGLCWAFRDFTIDDLYIFLRYARNLAQGHGIRYNPEGPPTEGVSSLLWTLMLSGLIGAGAEPPAAAKILSVLFGTACVALSQFAIPTTRAAYRILATFLVAVSAPLVIWSVSGMGASFAAFYALLWMLVVQRAELTNRNCLLLGLLSAGGTLVRPEAALLWPALLVFVSLSRSEGRMGALLMAGLGGILVWVPLEVFRIAYFGHLLPAPFYAKAVEPGLEQHLRGAYYVYEFIISYCGGAIALIALVWTFSAGEAWRGRGLPLALVTTAWILFPLLAGDDWMPQFRFLVPAIPAMMVMIAATVEQLCERVSWPRGLTIALAVAIFGLLYASQGAGMWLARNDNHHYANYRMQITYHTRAVEALRAQGLYLRDHGGAEATVAAHDIGIIGFISGAEIIDLWGLTDYEMAVLTPDRRADKALQREPDFWQTPWPYIQRHPEFQQRYEPVEAVPWHLYRRID